MSKNKKPTNQKSGTGIEFSEKDLSLAQGLRVPEREPTKRFSVDCPLSWYRKLKKLANLSGTSIAHVVRNGLDQAYGLSDEEES
jgi:hypothetical protein